MMSLLLVKRRISRARALFWTQNRGLSGTFIRGGDSFVEPRFCLVAAAACFTLVKTNAEEDKLSPEESIEYLKSKLQEIRGQSPSSAWPPVSALARENGQGIELRMRLNGKKNIDMISNIVVGSGGKSECEAAVFDAKSNQQGALRFTNDEIDMVTIPRSGGNVIDINIRSKNGLGLNSLNSILEAYRLGTSDMVGALDSLEKMGIRVYNSSIEGHKRTWDDVGGYEGIKNEIQNSLVLALKYPEVYDRIGKITRGKNSDSIIESNRPRAVLFEGIPGTGKSQMARVIAGSVNVPLVYVPLEAIVSKWYGESEKNLSEIFEKVSLLGDSIIFLDEIDSLGHSRDQDMHEVSRRVLSVLLQRIEGFVENSDSRTIVIGATNRKQDLDSALLSRFDLSITFPPPSEIERKAIFKIYASHLRDDDLEILASSSSDLTGRDIRDVCTHAEREHASKLILSHEKLNDPSKIEVTAPNLDAYLSALTRRFESIQVHRAP